MQPTLDGAAFEARVARHEDLLVNQQSAVFFRPFASASVRLELPHTGRCFLFCRRISLNDGTFADYTDLHEMSSSENHEAKRLRTAIVVLLKGTTSSSSESDSICQNPSHGLTTVSLSHRIFQEHCLAY